MCLRTTASLSLSYHSRLAAMPVHLDPRCYPHLVEAILFNVSDHITWLAARLVSTAMLKLVDPLLCGHRLDIISDSNGKRKILSSDWPLAHPLWRTCNAYRISTRGETEKRKQQRSVVSLQSSWTLIWSLRM